VRSREWLILGLGLLGLCIRLRAMRTDRPTAWDLIGLVLLTTAILAWLLTRSSR